MAILYGTEPSFYTRKAWVGMRLMGLAVDDRLKSLAVKAEVEAAVGGYHRFPVVRTDDGDWLVDSTDLLAELSRRHPARSLLPPDPALAALAWIADDWIDEWFLRAAIVFRAGDPATRRWVAERGAKNLFGLPGDAPAPEALAPKLAKAAPNIEAFFIQSCAANAVTADSLPAVTALLDRSLAAFAMALESSPFLLGARPSLADAALWGFLDSGLLWEPAAKAHVAAGWPALADWHARVRDAADAGGAEGSDGADGGWDDSATAAARLEALLGGDALGFAPFLRANAAALLDGTRRVVIDGVAAPARGFTEKNRRRIGERLRALPPDALPDWPLIDAYEGDPA